VHTRTNPAVTPLFLFCFPFAGQPLGLLQDASSGMVQLWSADSLHEVAISNEDKDMWRIYLQHQVGPQARYFCRFEFFARQLLAQQC
jgi:hypothetical protein